MKKIFRVYWEERPKNYCKKPCCAEWAEFTPQISGTFEKYEDAQRCLDKMYYREAEIGVDTRNRHIQYAEVTDWKEYKEWEHS